jgi:hypothetical protein
MSGVGLLIFKELPMTVIKTRPQKEFVCLKNSVLQDGNLSIEALGLWAHCMSRPDNWTFHISQLCQHFGVGKNKLYKIINQLIAEGYAFRGQRRGEKEGGNSGKRKVYSGVEYIFFGQRLTESDREDLKKEFSDFQKMFPIPQNGDAENEGPQNETLQRLDSQNIHIEKQQREREGASPPPSAPPVSLFAFKRVSMREEEYKKLVEDFGEATVAEKLEALDEYADINPKKFKQYAKHSTVIRSWIKKDLIKNKLESNKSNTDLNPSQKETFRLNDELVNELKLDYPDRCSTMSVYYKNHIVKSKDPYFDISMLVDHKEFCKFLEKHLKIRILEVRFPNG